MEKKLRELKKGPVWIKGDYVRSEKKYSTYKFDDTNHERFVSGEKMVITDFEF